jgi:tetratricopeptide (TPR) repeat protein
MLQHTAEEYARQGDILFAQRHFAEAIASYDRAIALEPGMAELHYQRGNALRKLGRFESAVASYDQAITLRPDHAETYCNRGIALKELKNFELAVASYDRAIALNPRFFVAYANRGVALAAMDRHEQAIASFDQANSLENRIAYTHLHRGISLHALGLHSDALESYRKALALEPSNADAHHNLGILQLQLRRHDEAIASLDRALALEPRLAAAWANRALALAETGRHQAALAAYNRAIELEPDLRIAHRNASHLHLQLGNFEKGWQKFEWRLHNTETRARPRIFAKPLWLGKESVAGKTILLHSEQGLGDTLQFCRYATLVAGLGAQVVLEVQKPLVRLLANLRGVTRVIGEGGVLPSYDMHTPLLSLPLAFRTRIDTVPFPDGYIRTDAERLRIWEARLGARTRPRIGLVWSGNPLHKNDRNRSVPFDYFSNLLADGYEYVCLQKEIRESDRKILNRHPEILRFQLDDFVDTAALCGLMDVIVSVDTSVAHLAGALGRPVWILLPFNPDWRWLLDRQDSPWYSSARLYREDRLLGWHDAFERIRADLRNLSHRP